MTTILVGRLGHGGKKEFTAEFPEEHRGNGGLRGALREERKNRKRRGGSWWCSIVRALPFLQKTQKG
jgi:hypothetical protein